MTEKDIFNEMLIHFAKTDEADAGKRALNVVEQCSLFYDRETAVSDFADEINARYTKIRAHKLMTPFGNIFVIAGRENLRETRDYIKNGGLANAIISTEVL